MKQKIYYECTQCEARHAAWTGRCTNCGAWNSIVEKTSAASLKLKKVKSSAGKVFRLDEIELGGEERIETGIRELDRVLGGGIMPGSIIIVGGDPGIGKSTLMLQLCGQMEDGSSLYVTGEESLAQVRYRSMRLPDIKGSLSVMAETNAEAILQTIKSTDAKVVVVDSIQSIYSDNVESTPGSVAQLRECAAMLMQAAKTTGKAVFIIGHVTKEGVIAGPKLLEHMVDTVLQFEGEKTYSYRILRSLKNRFGSTNEIGIFRMEESGLQEVKNPSEIFLAGSKTGESGISIVSAMEGTRPLMLEVQALVTQTNYGVPQRTTNGYDGRRLQMILAVLEKRLGLQFRSYDVFVNIAGGVYINDPSVDLGIAAALVSSLRDSPISPKTAIIGEIGLTGEIRSVTAMGQRISEAEKLGFEKIVLPLIKDGDIKKGRDIELLQRDRLSLAFQDIMA
ncbi:MAG: DNA repair protein RadA [Candidatus Kapaibacterium sp.]